MPHMWHLSMAGARRLRADPNLGRSACSRAIWQAGAVRSSLPMSSHFFLPAVSARRSCPSPRCACAPMRCESTRVIFLAVAARRSTCVLSPWPFAARRHRHSCAHRLRPRLKLFKTLVEAFFHGLKLFFTSIEAFSMVWSSVICRLKLFHTRVEAFSVIEAFFHIH